TAAGAPALWVCRTSPGRRGGSGCGGSQRSPEWSGQFQGGRWPLWVVGAAPPVCVIHALIEGLVLQRILSPELFPDEVFFAAFEALARHRSEPNLDATTVAEEPSAGKGPAFSA